MFSPRCLPILIGSLPLKSHLQATEVILDYTPQIPLWPQLPKNQGEGMLRQFLDGFPCLVDQNSSYWIDNGSTHFVTEMTRFYEHYLEIDNLETMPQDSKFGLNPTTAQGFFTLQQQLEALPNQHVTVKGQVTGPITTGIGVKSRDGSSLLYDDNLCDMLIKLLSCKARWQVEQLHELCGNIPPIIFIDEPGFVNFGSTAYSGVSRELVSKSVSELIKAIKKAGGLAGLHICANGDWGPALLSDADIISFDGYSYFENLILFKEQLTSYIAKGGILAWGIVPTADPEIIERECVESLYKKWLKQLELLKSLGFSGQHLRGQTLIAPACGTGSLSLDMALKVLSMTRELSDRIRQEYQI